MTIKCFVCGAADAALVRRGTLSGPLSASLFQITDRHYGMVADIFRCNSCGFLFCPNVGNVLNYYSVMEDTEYERTRAKRALQAKRLLDLVTRWKTRGRLFDIGAGSGILVGEAARRGFDAEGIDPSDWLCQRATDHRAKVYHGVLPDVRVVGPYDIVTLVDVIEHVSDPVSLLVQARDLLADDGLGVVVTPDLRSVAARLMGTRWWHYRVAHIGYFSRQTLELAIARAGLAVVHRSRPMWYFPADYLFDRVVSYMPTVLRPRAPKFLAHVTVPLNLFDSMLYVFRKRPAGGV